MYIKIKFFVKSGFEVGPFC